MRVAARARRHDSLSWLEPLSLWSATLSGCALGLDAIIAAGLAYGHTHAVAFAAITAAGAGTVSTAALIVALHAVARSQRGH